MIEPKFTKGPWKVEDARDMTGEIWITAQHPGEYSVSHAAVRPGCIEAQEIGDTDANAYLICAAPDLFAFVADYAANSACSCDDWMTTPKDGRCSHCQAVALVVKALGKGMGEPT